MGKENFHNCKRKCPERPRYYLEVRGQTIGNTVNFFLQLKVSDGNNSKTRSIDLSSFKMHLSIVVVVFKLKFGRMIANLVAHMTQFMVWQKDQYSSIYIWLPEICCFAN